MFILAALIFAICCIISPYRCYFCALDKYFQYYNGRHFKYCIAYLCLAIVLHQELTDFTQFYAAKVNIATIPQAFICYIS